MTNQVKFSLSTDGVELEFQDSKQ